jgi:release factor glutamine methyltransferase
MLETEGMGFGVRRLLRAAIAPVHRAYVLRRVATAREARLFGGHRLLTDPRVFHPVCFRSTRVLLGALNSVAGLRVLDMGTGSGSLAVFAAARGATVTACDVNPHAVALAKENVRRNGVEAEVLESNLFAALPGRQFDLICFNIPFYPKPATTPLEAAFYAGPNFETVRDFAAGCRAHLAPQGRVMIVFSEDSGHQRVLSIFSGAGLRAIRQETTQRLFERFHVVWLVPDGDA